MSPVVLAAAVLVAAGVQGLVQALLPGLLGRAGVVDVPGPRSSHATATPRGGGLAVLAGLMAGGAVQVLAAQLAGAPGGTGTAAGDELLLLVLGAALAAGAVGLAEDVRGLPPTVRALLQLLVGAGAGAVLAHALGLSPVWVPVAALCLAAYVNAANFMDGADTMTAWHCVVAGSGYAAAAALAPSGAGDGPGTAWLVPAGLLLATAGAVFALSNGVLGGPARLFLGDVGSYAVGAAVAVLAGAGFLCGLPLVTAVAPLTVWVADVGHTLLLRLAAGERLAEAHRTHAYQRLVDSGWSHRRVAATAAAVTGLCVLTGLVVLLEPAWRLPGAAVLVLVAWVWVKLPAWRGHPSPWGRVAQARVRGGSR